VLSSVFLEDVIDHRNGKKEQGEQQGKNEKAGIHCGAFRCTILVRIRLAECSAGAEDSTAF